MPAQGVEAVLLRKLTMADQSYLLTFLSGATAQLEEPLRDLMGNMWMHHDACRGGSLNDFVYFNPAKMCQE